MSASIEELEVVVVALQERVATLEARLQKSVRFGVFTEYGTRSISFPEEFDSEEEARRFFENWGLSQFGVGIRPFI